ncbi:MAG: DUF4394 domain-containing protein [Phycisphaerales bacterium]|nr:DUF4394 domain-containing protein [Phycisphaerales bacterium]
MLTTVFAVTDNNVLLQFDSQTPGIIERSVPITGLPSNERIAAIDFKPGTGGAAPTLFGVASGNRTPFYAINPTTGVATRFSNGLQGGFPLNYAVGFDYDDLNNQFRYSDELGGSYRFNDLLNDFTNTAGISGLTDVAFRPTGGDADLFQLIGVRFDSDSLVVINATTGAIVSSGTLGVDVEKWVGLDIAADGSPILSVRTGGVARLGTINSSDGHTFADLGVIGDGSLVIRGLTVDPTLQAAPTLNTGLAVTYGTINEDSGATEGVTISALIGGAAGDLISDPNPAALEGLAITGSESSAGIWQYKLGGGSWQDVGVVSVESSLLLPADGVARVRFVPAANFNGTIAQALGFRAWDQTGANSGDRVALGPGGGASGFSTEGSFASVVVLPVADRASIDRGAGAAIPITEHQTAAPFAGFTISYVDNPGRTLTTTVSFDLALGTITPQSVAASGFAQVDASTFRFVGTAAAATAAARLLAFKPAANSQPSGQQSLALLFLTVDDSLVGIADALSPFIIVSSVNDEPAVAGVSAATIGIADRQAVTPFAGASIIDGDLPAQTLTLDLALSVSGLGSFTPESLALAGFAAIDPTHFRFTGNAAAATGAIRLLVFLPVDGAAPAGSVSPVSIGLTVSDGVAAPVGIAGPTIAITSIDHAPAIEGVSVTPIEITDKQTAAPFTGLSILDVDSPAGSLTLEVTIPGSEGVFTAESLSVSGFVSIGAGAYRVVGNAAGVTGALRQLVFAPTENLAAPGSITPIAFGLSVADGVNPIVLSGGPTINVTSLNDEPAVSGTIASNGIRIGKAVRAFRRIVVSDPDLGQSLTTIVRLSKPAKGAFTATSLRNSGFVRVGNGRYRFVGSAAAAQLALRRLAFKFNASLAGQTPSLRATLTITDPLGAIRTNGQTNISLKL